MSAEELALFAKCPASAKQKGLANSSQRCKSCPVGHNGYAQHSLVDELGRSMYLLMISITRRPGHLREKSQLAGTTYHSCCRPCVQCYLRSCVDNRIANNSASGIRRNT